MRAVLRLLATAMLVFAPSLLAQASASPEWSFNGTVIEACSCPRHTPGMTPDPVVIKNLKYWGVPRNDGFVLMPNEVEAYRAGDKPFEFRGTNGFMITVDITSKDVQPATTQKM